jgi:hypothetical protein
MSQKSSLPQPIQSVSRVLTADTRQVGGQSATRRARVNLWNAHARGDDCQGYRGPAGSLANAGPLIASERHHRARKF